MSDYYSRETGFDALCRIMGEREKKGDVFMAEVLISKQDKSIIKRIGPYATVRWIESGYNIYLNNSISDKWSVKTEEGLIVLDRVSFGVVQSFFVNLPDKERGER